MPSGLILEMRWNKTNILTTQFGSPGWARTLDTVSIVAEAIIATNPGIINSPSLRHL